MIVIGEIGIYQQLHRDGYFKEGLACRFPPHIIHPNRQPPANHHASSNTIHTADVWGVGLPDDVPWKIVIYNGRDKHREAP
jgi:hypothetical protein